MPNSSWNCSSVAAWLPRSAPRPSSTPPASTTARVPNRSDSEPQKNDPKPMARKLSTAAVEMPARDQPMSCAIGCRKTPSDIIVPMPMQVTTMPAPTMTQP